MVGLPDPRSNLAVLGNDVDLFSKLQQLAPQSKPESFPPNLNPTRHTSCPDSRGRGDSPVSLFGKTFGAEQKKLSHEPSCPNPATN